MPNLRPEDLYRATVFDNDGDKVGKVKQVYLDDESGQPSWVTVNTGLLGNNESFIPLQSARAEGDDLHVPYDKKKIKDAPNFDPGHHMEPHEEDRLYDYYGMGSGFAGAGHDRDVTDRDRHVTDRDVTDRDRHVTDRDVTDRDRHVTDRDVTDRDRNVTGDESMVRREERLNVGKETREAGRARLRKHVVTEHQSVDVPVQREELHVEREALSGAEAERGGRIGEGDEESVVTLHEERAVADKDTVAVEKVNVGKRTVTDHQTVDADIKKEEIEVEQDGTAGRRTDRDHDLRDDRREDRR